MTEKAPSVLLIDDHEEELSALADRIHDNHGLAPQVRTPHDVEEDDLRTADLVVIDLTIDDWLKEVDEKLSAAGAREIAMRPPNGVALAGVLRQYSDAVKTEPPTGYALITGKPGSLGPLPAERRPHVISRLCNLNWFFEKKHLLDNARQIASLARAINSLPPEVQTTFSSLDRLVEFLGVTPSDPLFDRFISDVRRCRPPIHFLAERSHGLVVVRWLLHRILPHTCFLMDDFQLAARLRVSFDSLTTALVDDGPFQKAIAQFQYRGPLAEFDGRRWWRAGIEQWLWDQTEGLSAHPDATTEVVKGYAPEAEALCISRPVVTVDRDLRRRPEFAAFDDVVPLQLDDWPSYAEPAFAKKSDLLEWPELRDLQSERD